MKRLFQAGLAALGLGSKDAKGDMLTPAQFTAEFVATLRSKAPALKVEVIRDLELKFVSADGGSSTAYLNNAYDTYRAAPQAKADVVGKFAAAALETAADMGKDDGLNRDRIIPVVKDRGWLVETRKALESRGADKIPENVYEDLNSELVVLYAEDTPRNIRYFQAKDLEKANIDRSELRDLACANLKKLIPAPKRQGGDGIFMITAGGDYEASLLLYNKIWDGMKAEVKGEVVVAVPTRDLLLVTGSEDLQAIQKLKQIVQQAFTKGSYRLTTRLFVYRNGLFDVFEA